MPYKDPERARAYDREYKLRRYHEKRAIAIAFLGGKCKVCGTTEFLEFDHIDSATKEFPISQYWGTKRWWNEVLKCQLLCWVHHLEKSLANGDHIHKSKHHMSEEYEAIIAQDF